MIFKLCHITTLCLPLSHNRPHAPHILVEGPLLRPFIHKPIMIHMDVDIHSPGPHSPSFRSMRQYSGKRTRSPEPSSPVDRPSVRLFLSPRLLLYAKWLILTCRKGFLWRLAF